MYDHPSKSEYVVVPNAGHDEPLYGRLRDHAVHHRTRTWARPSDHVPVTVDLG